MATSSDPAGIIAFTRARLDEDEASARDQRREFINGANGVPVRKGDWARLMCDPVMGPFGGQTRIRNISAGLYVARLSDPARVLLEVDAGRRLTDRYQRLLIAQERHAVAVAEWKADVDHEERTGQWAGAGNPGSRSHALLREGDYLTAMIPVVRELVAAKAAVWKDHPDYLKEWAL